MNKKYILFAFLFFCINLVLFSQSIVLDDKTYTVDTLSNFKVGPGSQHIALRLKGTSRLDVFFLKVDITNPYVTIKAALGRDSIYGGETPSSVAKRKTRDGAVYFAGTNGDFYDTGTYVGYPIAGSMLEGQIAKIPTTARKVFAFDENKIPYIGVMTYNGNVRFGENTWTINHVNHIRETNELVLYNQHNGKYTRTNEHGTEVLIQLIEGEFWGSNKTLKAKVVAIELNKGSMKIPVGHAILSGHGTAAANLNTLAINDELEISLNLLMDGSTAYFTEVSGGDNRSLMLKDGVVESNINNIWNELHPRTGLGYSQNKDTLIFCVVDGRGASVGGTTKVLAEIMQSAGVYTAFNMDGGGSSCMYIKEFGQVNKPSDGTERAVSNSIFAVSTAPTDESVAEIKSYTHTILLPKYGVFMPKFIGYNQYGVLIDNDLQGITLSCTPDVGEIIEDGRFLASGVNGGKLKATYNGIETELEVKLVTSAEIGFRLDSVLIDNRNNYPVEVQSTIGLNTMDVLPSALSWTVEDPTICTAENGVLKALRNGRTLVIGSLGEFKDTLAVNVEIPLTEMLLADNFNSVNWTLNATPAFSAVLNSENIPTTWPHGAAVNYVYKVARSPYITLSKNLTFYGQPDSLKLVFNAGDISFSRVILSLKANDSSQGVSKEYTSIEKNTDTEIAIALKDWFDTTDISTFPFYFDYLSFYIDPSGMTSGKSYTLALKDILLIYNDVISSSIPSVKSNSFTIYPNPTSGQNLYLMLNKSNQQLVKTEIYNLNGQIIASYDYGVYQGGSIIVPINKLSQGAYMLKVYENEQLSVQKFVVY